MAPDFLIIPYQIIIDPTLRPTDRVLYGVIYWLAKMKDGHCYASNGYLEDVCQVKLRAVQEGLARLEAAGYVRRVFDKHQSDRTKRDEIIPLVTFSQVRTNVQGGVRTNVHQSYKSPNKNKINIMKAKLKTKLSL